ncbi:MAG: hypothetical protein AAGC57_20355, partial [Pseudomonadota bacterium]
WFMLPGKPLPYQLHSVEWRRAIYDSLHGEDVVVPAHHEGIFLRHTPGGKPKWQRRPMDQAVPTEPPEPRE